MRNKFIPLAVALVFGTVAAVGFSKMMKAQPQSEAIEIYVAARVINPSEEVTQDALKLERWPADRVPKDAFNDWSKLEGKFAAQRIFDGEPIVVRKLMDDKVKSVNIPKGCTVVSLKTDEASSVANLIAPGDRVDVIGFFTKSDVIPETTTRTVLSGVRVWAVDGITSREELKEGSVNQAARTVQLLIHKDDAEAWTWANEMAKIRLSLGRPDDGLDQNKQNGPNPAGLAFVQWLTDYQIARQTAASESNNSETKTSFAATEPTQSAKPTNNKPNVQHQMVKIGQDGRMSVYKWEEGNPIPTITVMDETADSAASQKNDPVDLDYLNGSLSPLFQDPSGITKALGLEEPAEEPPAVESFN